jgi:hypothetical protein
LRIVHQLPPSRSHGCNSRRVALSGAKGIILNDDPITPVLSCRHAKICRLSLVLSPGVLGLYLVAQSCLIPRPRSRLNATHTNCAGHAVIAHRPKDADATGCKAQRTHRRRRQALAS